MNEVWPIVLYSSAALLLVAGCAWFATVLVTAYVLPAERHEAHPWWPHIRICSQIAAVVIRCSGILFLIALWGSGVIPIGIVAGLLIAAWLTGRWATSE